MVCIIGADTPLGKIISTIKGPVSLKAHGQKPDPSSDIVIYAGETPEISHPTDTLKAYLNLCKGRFIYMSSYQVYGHGFKPLSEVSNLKPVTEFGRMKAVHENLVRDCSDYVILRISEPYGIKNGGDFVSAITTKVLDEEPITGKNAVLDFIYKDDLVKAINSVIDNNIICKTLNVGTNTGKSVSDLAEVIGRVYGKGPVLNFEESQKNPFNVINSEKIRHLTGWVSRVELEQAIPVIKAM